MNVEAAFQRAMDIAFVGEKDKFVLIYLDDITVYSSSHQDHLQHLKKVFLKCRRFGISVNPKKSQFALEEGKILGHVVSAAGVRIDPERVKEIQTLSVSRSKKDIRSFLGKINFVRRFIPNFAELVKNITSMLKKSSEIKWTDAARKSFDSIKKAIMEAPTLISPDYSKEFHIFSFASEDTLVAILLQVDEEGSEHPVAFFSKALRDAELRYDIVEKQAYSLIKYLKAFRVYIFHSKIIAYVPFAAIKDVLTQPDADGKRARWIAKLMEFNVELKPTKLVRVEVPALKTNTCKRTFQQWGLDFIGEVNPHSSGQYRWILVATDYFTKWIEAIPTRKVDHNMVMKFLTENIFTRFACPHKLVTDNATAFRAKELVDISNSMGIKLVHSTSYYPQGNGLAESSNKSLIRIIKNLLDDNKKNWDSKLKYALWADRVTIKRSTGNSPFNLVYGTEAIFPIQLTLPVAKFLQTEQNEEEEVARRITDLAKIHHIREPLVEKAAAHRKKIKEAFDRNTKADNFQVGDLVLKWDALKEKKDNHGKFNAFWTGPFIISQIQGNNTFIMQSMGGEAVFDGPVNGRFLKIYLV
eukprot:PITA_32933